MEIKQLQLLETRGSEDGDIDNIITRCHQYYNAKQITTQYGTLVEETLVINNQQRSFVIHIPTDSTSKDMLLFYHGSRGNAMYSALELTRWIENKNLLCIFGQAVSPGPSEQPHCDKHYGGVSYGELYWEIRDHNFQFHNDLEYTQAIITFVKEKYHINKSYFVGHSNGGVFACLLALYLPNTFDKIISHMGGIGFDPHFYLDYQILKSNDRRTPLLFYTGENDIHKQPCEAAKSIFEGDEFPASLYIHPELGHDYEYHCEQYIYEWFQL